MKKNLIAFIVLTISIFGIGISKIDALTGNEGTDFPDKPNDGNTNFIIYKASSNYSDSYYSLNKDNIYMITVDDSVNNFESSSYNSSYSTNGITIDFIRYNNETYANRVTKIPFKVYRLVNNSWSLVSNVTNKTYSSAYRVGYLYYSSVNIYYGVTTSKSTYPENMGFIPGLHQGPTLNFAGLSSAESDRLRYEHIHDELTYEADEYVSSFVFDEIINVNNYSQLEFTFELPMQTLTCTKDTVINGIPTQESYDCLFDLDYDIKNTDVDGVEDMSPFGIPYLLETKLYDNGNMSITKTDTIPLANNNSNSYSGNYFIEPNTDITSLKLVIPLEFINYTWVKIYFKSNLKYEINYVDRDTIVTDYFETVDITGKAGITFKPKQIVSDFMAGFNFGPKGAYTVQLKDNYVSPYNMLNYYNVGFCDMNYIDDGNVQVVPTSCFNGFQAYFNLKKGNENQVVTVLNRNYGTSNSNVTSTVTYDTRYFSYVIHDRLDSSPVIKDPISGEDIVIGNLYDFDDAIKDISNSGFFSSVTSAFNYFKGSIIYIFQNISYSFSHFPIELRYFFIVVFSLILFAFAIKFIL